MIAWEQRIFRRRQLRVEKTQIVHDNTGKLEKHPGENEGTVVLPSPMGSQIKRLKAGNGDAILTC